MTNRIALTDDLSEVPTSALILAFNYAARVLGVKEVTKFQDRATAEKRVKFQVSQIMDLERRPQPFGPVDPVTGQNPEAPAPAIPAPAPQPAGNKENSDVTDNTTQAQGSGAPAANPAPADPNALNFGEREGTKRKRLIDVLVANRGKFVPQADIIRAVYGDDAKGDDAKVTADFKGPLSMVMKGLTGMIEKNKMPVTLQKQKEGKAVSYGLIDAGK